MQLAEQQQQTAWNYALAKIDRIYANQKESEAKKRLQTIRKQRRQLLSAKVAFQKELDKAISSRMQAGLGMKVILDRKRLPQVHFVVCFEFLGQWLLTCNKGFFGHEWQCCVENQNVVTHCTTGNLEHRLCYALGKHKNTIRHKVPVLRLLPSLRAS